jgi:hypothetical protein
MALSCAAPALIRPLAFAMLPPVSRREEAGAHRAACAQRDGWWVRMRGGRSVPRRPMRQNPRSRQCGQRESGRRLIMESQEPLSERVASTGR